jgi:hypothetical protein
VPDWFNTKFEASTETLIVMSMDPLPYGVIQELRNTIRKREHIGMEGGEGIVLWLSDGDVWWETIHPLLEEMGEQARENLAETGRQEQGYLYLDPEA